MQEENVKETTKKEINIRKCNQKGQDVKQRKREDKGEEQV